MSHEPVDVVVIGAGVCGLVAARELRRDGLSVLVLESAERVGGRTLVDTSTLNSRVDLGGTWVGHDHERVAGLAKELGLTQFPMHATGWPRIVEGPRRVKLTSPSAVTALMAIGTFSIAAALCGPAGRDVSVGAWLRRVPGATAKRLLDALTHVSWTVDPDQISVRALAEIIRMQGGLRVVLATRGGAQDSLLVEGLGSIAEMLTTQLGPAVQLGQRVTAIDRDDSGVTVRTSNRTVRASAAIVTAPPPMAAAIRHDPPLPTDRIATQDQTFMGTVFKAVAVYSTPFWRARGGGDLLALGSPGCGVFDTSPPAGPGHLSILISGPDALLLDTLTAQERKKLILHPLVAHLGPGVLSPGSWHEKAWHLDRHVGGGYIALPRIGSAMRSLPMPCAPTGRVHWAGSETAHHHPGYVEGAIEAGCRVAREVTGSLGASA